MLGRKGSDLQKIFFFFSILGKGRIAIMVTCALVAAVLDVLGIGLIFPFVGILSDVKILHTNSKLSFFYGLVGASSDGQFLIFLGFFIISIIGLRCFFLWCVKFINFRFAFDAQHIFAKRLVESYLSRDYMFFTEVDSSLLLRNVVAITGSLVTGLMIPFINISADILLLLAFFGVLLFVNPLITVFLFGAVGALFVILHISFKKKITAYGNVKNTDSAAAYKLLRETFQAIKNVKIAGREEFFIERFLQKSRSLSSIETKFNTAMVTPALVIEFLGMTSILASIIYMIASGTPLAKIIPVISFYVLAAYRILPTSTRIPGNAYSVRFYTHALEVLYQELTHLDGKQNFISSNNPINKLPIRESLVLENICFKYPRADRMTISDIHLTIKKNSTYALVGASGAGKTTLVDIMMGLYEPTSGKLKVDGKALTSENIISWRRSVGDIPQQIYLSDDSIARNIAFGIPDKEINRERLKEVLRVAQLEELTDSLPEGVDTAVGEGGVRLSGGQRQRIGIARALYPDPELVIMDEATAALDNLTEAQIMEEIGFLSKMKTLLIIAHRLSTVRNAETIFVLDEGRLLASGSYTELIRNCPLFSKMVSISEIKKSGHFVDDVRSVV